MVAQISFHPAAVSVGRTGGGFSVFSRFALGSFPAIASFSRIQSSPTVGACTVVTHRLLTPFANSGSAPSI